MKFFHLSDLHLGKRVNGFSMIEDQKNILDQIIGLIDSEQPDAVIIAGDVYDKAIPPVEAVNMFDDFLAVLASKGLQVFIISGNHDSAERISYGGRVMEQSGIHISPRISGSVAGPEEDASERDEESGLEETAEKKEKTDAEETAEKKEHEDPSFMSETGEPEETAETAEGEETQESSGPCEPAVIRPVVLEDAFGPVMVYLFPYIHPSVVREAYPDEKVTDWTSAMEVLVRKADVDPETRNIAVAHQFVTAAGVKPEQCDSEQKRVGGIDNVDFSVFDTFDYVALGHLHGPQRIGRDTVRYAGSPLKYSFSEENQKKSVTVVEFREKGQVDISQIRLIPVRDFRTVRGSFEELMSPEYTAPLAPDDYYRVILTDENDIDQALSRLRVRFYHNLMELDYDNTRTRTQNAIEGEEEALEKEPIEVLKELYLKKNGLEMNAFQTELAEKLIDEIWNTI